MEKQYPNQKQNTPKGHTENPNKSTSLTLGVYVSPELATQPHAMWLLEGLRDPHHRDRRPPTTSLLINTASVTLGNFLNTVHGTQGP